MLKLLLRLIDMLNWKWKNIGISLSFSAGHFLWISQRGYAITCLLIPTGKLDPLVARLMGATTATLVGEGADCRFLGGKAGGGLQDTTGIDASITTKKTFRGFRGLFFR